MVSRSSAMISSVPGPRASENFSVKFFRSSELSLKLNQNEVLVPGSLALLFDIILSGGHANNFLVQNIMRALIDKLVLMFAGTVFQDMVGQNIYKIVDHLFVSQEKRDGMILEGIQNKDLCKIRSGAGDKKTSGVDKKS